MLSKNSSNGTLSANSWIYFSCSFSKIFMSLACTAAKVQVFRVWQDGKFGSAWLGDLETWRLGDGETWRLGDLEDLETWGLGDLEDLGTWRGGDLEKAPKTQNVRQYGLTDVIKSGK